MSQGYLKNGKIDIAWWRTQVNAGIAYRKKFAHEERWATWRKYYRGQWSGDVLPSNLFFRMARTIVPRIYFRNPSVSISPRKPGMLQWAFAQLLERVDNKMIRTIGVKKQMKRAIQNAFFFGVGINKLGYGALYSPSASPFGPTSAPVNKSGGHVEYNALIQEDMPWFRSVHPGSFIVPAGTEELKDSRWVAEWIRRPREDVEEDSRFKNVRDLSSTSRPPGTMHSKMSNDFRNPVDMLDMIEIHDKKTGEVFVIPAYTGDKVLLHADDGLQIHGDFTYYDIIFNPDDEVFWGVPDSKILEPQQLEINEIRTQMMYHRRLSLIRILAKKRSISEDEAAKLVSATVSPIVWVEDNPDMAIKIIEGGDIPDGLGKMELSVMQDVRESMGLSRNEFGETSPANARTSAIESRIVKAASDIRIDERRDLIADILVDMIGHMNNMLFQNWTNEMIVDVAGPMGVPLWVKFKPQMLQYGSYDVKIDPDTALPETKDARMQKALVTYQTLRTNPIIDPIRLTRYLLHELHGVQFDDMMRGMPPGLGGPGDPMELEQYAQFMTQLSQQAPQALIAGPGTGAETITAPIDPTLFE